MMRRSAASTQLGAGADRGTVPHRDRRRGERRQHRGGITQPRGCAARAAPTAPDAVERAHEQRARGGSIDEVVELREQRDRTRRPPTGRPAVPGASVDRGDARVMCASGSAADARERVDLGPLVGGERPGRGGGGVGADLLG